MSNSRKFITKYNSEYVIIETLRLLTYLQYSANNEANCIKALKYSYCQEIYATFTITPNSNGCVVNILYEIDDVVDFNPVINELYDKFMGVPPLLRFHDIILPPMLEVIHFAHFNYPEISNCQQFNEDYCKLYDMYKDNDLSDDEIIETIKTIPDINNLFNRLLVNDELFNSRLHDITNNDARIQAILICKYCNNIQRNVKFVEFVADYAHTDAFNFTNWMYLIEIIKINKSVLQHVNQQTHDLIYTQLLQHTLQMDDYKYKLLIDAIYELHLF
jgi:hypothetical protein